MLGVSQEDTVNFAVRLVFAGQNATVVCGAADYLSECLSFVFDSSACESTKPFEPCRKLVDFITASFCRSDLVANGGGLMCNAR